MGLDVGCEAAGAAKPEPARRLLDWRSGGWLLAASGVLCAAAAGLWIWRFANQPATIGDGRHVATYGFDLTHCRVPRGTLVAAGFAKDGIPALVNPGAFRVAEVAEFSRELRRAHQGAYVLNGDLVIGVVAGGAARAYPVRVLAWHEVVNDALGGQPIVVTYNPLCDSSLVFDRQSGGETLEFGVSGLLYNSNLVMYDRRAGGGGESLWSQLECRAIAGPAAENSLELRRLPAVVVAWQDWVTRYPETTVLAPDRNRMRVYENTYAPYFGSERLRFPVEPLPPVDTPALKTAVVALRAAGPWHVYTLADLIGRADGGGECELTLDGIDVRIACRARPPAVWAEVEVGRPLEVIRCCWFAWYASHPVDAEWGLASPGN